jgi:glycosyltransferase involved in cell wall biosynthesis
MIDLAKRRDIVVVVSIHNFYYTNPWILRNVDYCYVPSEFARRYYWDNFAIDCKVLPNPIDWSAVRPNQRNPEYLTFINPTLEKGAFPFARIADELGRRRPDIPLLVVESRGTRDTLAACGLEPGAHCNICFMPHTSDPRRFWGITKIGLMPSLCWETQGLVAVEAMINGIPVIASDRGAIPETLGDSGFLLRLPVRLTSETKTLPTVEEMEPWVETIIRLWDDHALYSVKSAEASREAQRWHPDRLRPIYAEFFRNVHPQPGPPFLPKCAEKRGERGTNGERTE